MKSIYLAILLLILGLPISAETALWKSTSGSSVEASFVRMEGDSVVLQKADGGGELAVPVKLLAPESKAMLEALQKKAMPAEAPSEETEEAAMPKPVEAGTVVPFVPKPPDPSPKLLLPPSTTASEIPENGLSLFTNGRWEGLHAAYEHEKFDAVIDRLGRCLVYLKNDEGRRLSARHSFAINPNTPRTDGVHRPIQWVTSKEEASVQPERLRFSGLSSNEIEGGVEVEFEYTFIFKEDSITWYGHLERDNNDVASNFNLALRAGSMFGYDHRTSGDLDIDTAKILCGESAIIFRGGEEGPEREFLVWDVPESEERVQVYRDKHHEVEIALTAFAPRTLKLAVDPDVYEEVRPALISSDVRLLAIFGINAHKSDSYSDDRDESMTLTIE